MRTSYRRCTHHLSFSIATRSVRGEIPFRYHVLSRCFPVLRVTVRVAADSTMRFRLSNIRSTDPATMLRAVDSRPCPAVRGLHSWTCRIARTNTANVYGPRLALRDSVVKDRWPSIRPAVTFCGGHSPFAVRPLVCCFSQTPSGTACPLVCCFSQTPSGTFEFPRTAAGCQQIFLLTFLHLLSGLFCLSYQESDINSLRN